MGQAKRSSVALEYIQHSCCSAGTASPCTVCPVYDNFWGALGWGGMCHSSLRSSGSSKHRAWGTGHRELTGLQPGWGCLWACWLLGHPGCKGGGSWARGMLEPAQPWACSPPGPEGSTPPSPVSCHLFHVLIPTPKPPELAGVAQPGWQTGSLSREVTGEVPGVRAGVTSALSRAGG